MTRLIKKYKNRRLYDTEVSQYITIDTLQSYVLQGIGFRVLDASSNKDLTNATLLQIIVDMESGTTEFLSEPMLRQIIALANHPMHSSFQAMLEQMFASLQKPLDDNPYKKATEVWNKQMEGLMKQWQAFFDKK